MKRILSFFMIISIIALSGYGPKIYAEDTPEEIEARILYTKIQEFLTSNENCEPENFDEVCTNYIRQNFGSLTVLDKEPFDIQTKSDIVVYRGVSKKAYADNFKLGNIYIGNGLRGKGIYTTTSLGCAVHYTEGTGEIMTFAINKNAKIIDWPYFEKVLTKMQELHTGEFDFDDNDLIYDSMREWLETKAKEYFKERYSNYLDGTITQEEFNSFLTSTKQSEEYQILSKSRKKYYKDKKAAIFYNSGLLAKLLGYDAIRSIDYLSTFANEKEEEYLILNASVLTLCK